MAFVLQIIGWVLFIYGFLSLAQDIINEITYKNINHNMKIIVLTKELEKNIEGFTRNLKELKRSNKYKNIVVINLEENDNINNIVTKFESEELNLTLLTKDEGKEYIDNCFQVI